MSIESGFLPEEELLRRVVVSFSPKTNPETITEEMVARALETIGTPDKVRQDGNVKAIKRAVLQQLKQ